ncbi:hypothetical protein [Labedaea rhizosphaerae]|uniref:hypothetical protein n=1 Tax=Labedaea rhizosphaerae TaxID=598644 RepID=UPI001AACBB32|nr:hypothetical protein [Labedaea rhizosphaerae]
MEHNEDELWEWARQTAASAPLWSDERWERINATLGIKLAEPDQQAVSWSEAA